MEPSRESTTTSAFRKRQAADACSESYPELPHYFLTFLECKQPEAYQAEAGPLSLLSFCLQF